MKTLTTKEAMEFLNITRDEMKKLYRKGKDRPPILKPLVGGVPGRTYQHTFSLNNVIEAKQFLELRRELKK